MPGPPVDELLDWARSLRLVGRPDAVRTRPWATTCRIGDVWLKACGPGGAHEAPLLGALLWWGAPHAVLPLAVDAGRGLVALPHGGDLLRDTQPGPGVWTRLLPEHAVLQRRLQPHADDAVAAGVPHLHPARLPAELDALLDRTALSDDVRAAVAAAAPAFAERCALLADGPVADTVQHDDLHDGNVVVDAGGAARVLDWGDSAVGHPFGVLLVTLRALRRGGAAEDVVMRARDAYLEAWTDLADGPTLRALADAAVRVQPLARALAWERALRSADDAERTAWGDPVAGWLELLAGTAPVRRG